MLSRLVYGIATGPGIVFLIIGFSSKNPQRNYLLHWWTLGFFVSMFLFAKLHKAHDYYQLPIVFITSIYMAHGVSKFLDKKNNFFYLCSTLAVFIIGLMLLWFNLGPVLYLYVPFAAIYSFLIIAFLVLRKEVLLSITVVVLCVFMGGFSFSKLRHWFPNHHHWQCRYDRKTFGERVNSLTEPNSPIITKLNHRLCR